MSESIGGVTGAIQSVIGWIGTMIDKLNSVEIPEWLQRESPSPIEQSLWGMSDALRQLSRGDLPAFSYAMSGVPGGVASSSVSNTNNVTFNVSANRFDAASEGRAALAMLGGV